MTKTVGDNVKKVTDSKRFREDNGRNKYLTMYTFGFL
jgi:hypothetical protein